MADDSWVAGLKDIIRKYLMLFPFVRKEEFAEIILNPSTALPKEIQSSSIGKGFRDAIIPAYFSFIFSMLIAIPVGLAINAATGGNIATSLIGYAVSFVGLLILTPVFVAIAMLLVSAIYFIMAKILGGKGTFTKTMGMLGTIMGPFYLLGIIPNMLDQIPLVVCIAGILGIPLGLYNLYMQFRMIKALHGFDDIRAAAVIIVPIILLVALAVAAVLVLASTIGLSYMNSLAAGLPSSSRAGIHLKVFPA
jgi:hypothetical protein